MHPVIKVRIGHLALDDLGGDDHVVERLAVITDHEEAIHDEIYVEGQR